MKTIIKLLLVILCFSVVGCGARKVNKFSEENESISKSKKDTAVALKMTENVKKDIVKEVETNVKIKEDSSEEKTTYEPIEPDKPMVIEKPDGTKEVYHNTKVVKENKKKEKVEEKKEQTKETDKSKTDLKIDSKASGTVSTDNQNKSKKAGKVVDQESVFSFSFFIYLFLFLLLCYGVWKYRKKIPIIKNYF